MPLDLARRGFLLGALMAPAVVRAASIMRVRDPNLVKGIWLNGGLDFEPIDNPNAISKWHETVWVHKSNPAVVESFAARARFQTIATGIAAPTVDRVSMARANLAARQAAWLANPENAARLKDVPAELRWPHRPYGIIAT